MYACRHKSAYMRKMCIFMYKCVNVHVVLKMIQNEPTNFSPYHLLLVRFQVLPEQEIRRVCEQQLCMDNMFVCDAFLEFLVSVKLLLGDKKFQPIELVNQMLAKCPFSRFFQLV